MRKYKRRPIEIEAMQYLQDSTVYYILHWINSCQDAQGKGMPHASYENDVLTTPTYEDDACIVNIGDWIVKGERGELYLLKSDDFNRLYEPDLTHEDKSTIMKTWIDTTTNLEWEVEGLKTQMTFSEALEYAKSFGNGCVNSSFKSVRNYVRCVRSGKRKNPHSVQQLNEQKKVKVNLFVKEWYDIFCKLTEKQQAGFIKDQRPAIEDLSGSDQLERLNDLKSFVANSFHKASKK